MNTLAENFFRSVPRFFATVALACVLLLSAQAGGQTAQQSQALQLLTAERQVLTIELAQYRKTLDILQTDGVPAQQSDDPAVKKLAQEVVNLKKRLITVTEQEVTLLQAQIAAAKVKAKAEAQPATAAVTDSAATEVGASNPVRAHDIENSLVQDAENVQRLLKLLASYYTELQESARTLPTAEEVARRETAQRDAETQARIPFSVDKVRLNGAEGSTALTRITQRLMDPAIPESRRDIAPICIIKTRLFGSLVGSESRSLKPVGKNHYIARVRLQPGDTTLSIMERRWEVRLPQHVSASDFLVTLYRPPGDAPELHVFSVDELLAENKAHIPAWLPDELNIKTNDR